MTKEQILLITEYIASLLLSLHRGDKPLPLPEGITLGDVYKVAARHSLAPAAYVALAQSIDPAGMTEALRAAWSREAELATVQHIRHTAAFAELTRALTSAEICFLPIKGFIIKKLWSHPELRTMADIDIVVDKVDFERAGQCLTSIGYTLDHGGDIHYSYHKGSFINVELHRTLYDDATETFADWTPREDNPFWYVMSYEDLAVFLLRHAYKHYQGGGCGLRTIYDFYLLFEKHGRPEENALLTEKLSLAGLGDFARTVTALVDRWFCGVLDESSYDAAIYVATGGVYGTLDNRVSYSVNQKGSRTKHVLSRLFPSYKVISTRYKWVKKCPILLPIGYLVRLVTSIFDGKARREMQSVGKTDRK